MRGDWPPASRPRGVGSAVLGPFGVRGRRASASGTSRDSPIGVLSPRVASGPVAAPCRTCLPRARPRQAAEIARVRQRPRPRRPKRPPRPSAPLALRPFGPYALGLTAPKGEKGEKAWRGPDAVPGLSRPWGLKKPHPQKTPKIRGGRPPQFGLKFLKTPSIRGSTPLILGGHF